MLAIEHIVVRVDDWRLDANLSLPRGASVAVLGPSGSGKSTLLGAVAGFVNVKNGRILWDGNDITDTPPAQRPVTVLFQDHNLFPHLTVAENVGLGLRPSLRLDADEQASLEAALRSVGLGGYEGRRPGQLSGGERQRVALARALIRDRPLLLLDEPFAALGPALRREMLDLVARLREKSGATLIMVTHEPGDARRIASHTVVVEDGRVGSPIPTERLFAAPPPELRAYLGE
jgi:thiamine transport system ATP-binding protein